MAAAVSEAVGAMLSRPEPGVELVRPAQTLSDLCDAGVPAVAALVVYRGRGGVEGIVFRTHGLWVHG